MLRSDSHDHGDGRVRDVVLDLEVFHVEVLNVVHLALELDLGEREGLSLQLDLEGLDVVVVDVGVAQRVDELASLQTCSRGYKSLMSLRYAVSLTTLT